MSYRSRTGASTFPLSVDLLAETADIAFNASVHAITGGNLTSGASYVFTPGGALENAELFAAPLIAFAAAGYLLSAGKDARVAAGSAIWSVGPKDLDTLDHGIAQHLPPKTAIARGEFHTWVVCDGWLIDFAARTLPAKFDRAHRIMPFSTGRGKWRAFPKTIRHDLSKPMPDPLRNPRAAYRYYDRGPDLLEAATSRLGVALRKAEVRAMELAA